MRIFAFLTADENGCGQRAQQRRASFKTHNGRGNTGTCGGGAQ